MNRDTKGKNEKETAVIGIAWRTITDSISFKYFCRAIEEAEAEYVFLDQLLSADLKYEEAPKPGRADADKGKNDNFGEPGNNNYRRLAEGVDGTGALTKEAGKILRRNSWHGSGAKDLLKKIDGVLFTGGQDVSPSLFKNQKPWHKIQKERDYLAERDVSDYLLMSYCLDHDIPFLGACRGMQMLGVVSGAAMIQDIPSYFISLRKEYKNEHRPFYDENTPKALWDFASNNVRVERDTLLYDIVQKELLKGCPCWHHQAIENVDGTMLKVSGHTVTGGVSMIEAVERRDKSYALGVQFHPEAPVWKKSVKADNRYSYLDYEISLQLFRSLALAGLKYRERKSLRDRFGKYYENR